MLFALTFLTYLPALRNGWIWDDDHYLTRNPALNDAGGLVRIWTEPAASPQYYPAVFTSFWIERRLFGLRPAGYHLTNIALQGLNAACLWKLLEGLELPGALLAAALFAVHPIEAESVAWVTERKNVLSGFFYLLALLAYLGYRKKRGTKPSAGRRPYLTSLAFFVLAMLSKTVSASMPVAALLIIAWKEGKWDRRELARLLPFFAAAVAGGLATVYLERHLVGAMGKEWDLGAWARLLLAGRSFWFYAGKIFWPAHLAFIYPRWRVDPAIWWQWLFTPACLLLVLILWIRRKQIGRGPLAAVLFFAAALVPALGFFDVYPFRFSYVADHFQYHAGVGILALAAAGATVLARRLRVRRPVCWVAGGVVVAVLAGMTFAQCRMYQDPETLWRATLERDPSAWMAETNLATVLSDEGRVPEALEHYQAALRLKPDYSVGENNLGVALDKLGRRDEAMQHYRRAIELDPIYASAYLNLANALSAKGDPSGAAEVCRRVLGFAPDHPQALNNYGQLLLQLGRPEEALGILQHGIQVAPGIALLWANLGLAQEVLHQLPAAETSFENALRCDPQNPDLLHRLQELRSREARAVPAR